MVEAWGSANSNYRIQFSVGARDGNSMKRLLSLALLILLGIICIYDGIILYGLEEVQLGPKPAGVGLGLTALICHVGGLAVCCLWGRVGLMSMSLLSVLGWISYFAFLLQDDQHHSLGSALGYSAPAMAYVLLSVTYAVMDWDRRCVDHQVS
jgi:drug/metabolite transporter (DMT)-like permease